MWVPVAVWQPCELLYTCYLLLFAMLWKLVQNYWRQARFVGYGARCKFDRIHLVSWSIVFELAQNIGLSSIDLRVSVSVILRVLDSRVSCAKTDESIDAIWWQTRVLGTRLGPDPRWKGRTSEGSMYRRTVTYRDYAKVDVLLRCVPCQITLDTF